MLRPQELSVADVRRAHAAGASDEDLRDAIYTCTLFQVMSRLADSLNFSLDGPTGGPFLARFGYRL